MKVQSYCNILHPRAPEYSSPVQAPFHSLAARTEPYHWSLDGAYFCTCELSNALERWDSLDPRGYTGISRGNPSFDDLHDPESWGVSPMIKESIQQPPA